MTGLQQTDRREFQRYRSSIAEELVTQANEVVSCALLDISFAGASVLCDPIAEDVVVKLRLEGFGEIKTSRLRTANGSERLLFRDGEFRIRRLVRFVIMLVDAGAALPVSLRRRDGFVNPQSESQSLLSNADDALVFRVNQAINLLTQASALDGSLPDNVVFFPVGRRPHIRTDPPPDRIA